MSKDSPERTLMPPCSYAKLYNKPRGMQFNTLYNCLTTHDGDTEM